MQLLAGKLIALQVVAAISDETVRETLKDETKPWRQANWCFPTIGAAFVWRMEDILDLYAEFADPHRSRVCLDEVPVQLVSETRTPPAGGPRPAGPHPLASRSSSYAESTAQPPRSSTAVSPAAWNACTVVVRCWNWASRSG